MLRPLVFCVLLSLVACAARGLVENPVGRTLTWFSYLGGEDIRAACEPGALERYRFVYNGVWGEQVRTYDLVASATGEGAILRSRVFGGASALNFNLADPFAAWRGASSRTRLSQAEFDRVRAAVRQSGFDRPAPEGAYFRSDEFYWMVSACRPEGFHFNAWSADSSGFAALPFFQALLPHDETGVAVNPPRQRALGPFAAYSPKLATAGGARQRFRLQVGENGLILGPTL